MIQTNCNTSWSKQSYFGEPQNGAGGRKLYRIKNKEQEGEKWKISDWLRPQSPPCLGWESPDFVWCLGIGWLNISCFRLNEAFMRHDHYLSLSLLMWHLWQEQLHLEPTKLFQQWSQYCPLLSLVKCFRPIIHIISIFLHRHSYV